MNSDFSIEVQQGERFEFGRNWTLFLRLLDDERIAAAEKSLRTMLLVDDLRGQKFLDIGSGSGLFSLAARRLGASVYSFDFDPNSVACTNELKRRYFSGDSDHNWEVHEGSALDENYLASLGKFDVVYSWGVLHHTGQMWRALDNVHKLVAPRGKLFIALYNDEGSQSRRWLWAKRTYNRLPKFLRAPFALLAIAPFEARVFLRHALSGKFREYYHLWTKPVPGRGMSYWRDIIDWVGGYPFEVAAPDEVFDFYRARNFELTRLVCKGAGSGCVEYVFERKQSQYELQTEEFYFLPVLLFQ